MKLLLSPAKSLNYKDVLPVTNFSKPHFIEESKIVNNVLKDKNVQDLKDLMSISDALAQLNVNRNQERTYQLNEISENVRQAVFTFNGDVYAGLDAYSIPSDKVDFMQNSVWILSGLYGILKPLDLIEAYRLEMGIKLDVEGSKDLYGFWKEKVTQHINSQMDANEVLLNLASKEYFSVIDKKKIKATIIHPEFKDYKDGKLKIISFFAKKARGLMARYIIDHQIMDVEDIKAFDIDGYRYDENLSTSTQWVFTR